MDRIQDKNLRVAILIAVGLLMLIVLRRAWISDDALITFRTIDNFLNGYGLRWNIIERVQTFTHPLWLFLVAIPSFFTKNITGTALFLSVALTFATVVALRRVAINAIAVITGIVILSLSQAFVDYSTSGLENALTHFLLVVYVIILFRQEYSPKSLFLLSFIASLGVTNRVDIGLIYLPSLFYVWLNSENRLQSLGLMALGQFPFLLWEIFAILYYGFPFPNTFYAKLNTGIDSLELAAQGVIYFKHSLDMDPLTLPIIILSIFASATSTRRLLKLSLSLGVILYLLYIIRIGGDFMTGRFFAAPLLVAVTLIISHRAFVRPQAVTYTFVPLIVGIFILGVIANPRPTIILEDHSVNRQIGGKFQGIGDERLVYASSGDIGAWLRQTRMRSITPFNDTLNDIEPRTISENVSVGMAGFRGGYDTHVIDTVGLGDPLLARLPAWYRGDWAVGHYGRRLPTGYEETLKRGYNLIRDNRVAEYYDKLVLITRGPIFSSERLETIFHMNLGNYDHLINRFRHQYGVRTYSIDQARQIFDGELSSHENCENSIQIPWRGVLVSLPSLEHSEFIHLEFSDTARTYRLNFYQDGSEVGSMDLWYMSGKSTLRIPQEITERGYTDIQVLVRFERSDDYCIYGLELQSLNSLFDSVHDSIIDVSTDDLILIQSALVWESHFNSYTGQVLNDVFNRTNTIYVTDNGVNSPLTSALIESANAYNPELLNRIDATINSGHQVYYILARDVSPSYSVVSQVMRNQPNVEVYETDIFTISVYSPSDE